MITTEHIRIYKKYGGDIDGFLRCAISGEKAIMTAEDWGVVNSLIQDFSFIKKGFTSDAFIKLIEERIIANCDNEKTIQMLKEIA